MSSFREVQDYFSADGPRKLPNLIDKVSFFRAPGPDQSDDFTHANAHNHVLILNRVFEGERRVFKLLLQPHLQIFEYGPPAENRL